MSLGKLSVPSVLTALALVFSGPFSPTGAEEKSAVDPQAERILKAAADRLKSAKEFSFHAEITFDRPVPSGTKVQFAASWDAAVKRPDMLRTIYRGDLRNSRTWYDGKTFTLLNTDRNFYSTWDAPPNIDELIAKLEEKLGVRIPLSTLLSNDPFPRMMENVGSATYAGLHLVNGVPSHHIVLVHEDIDAQVWIEEGLQFVVRKVVLNFKSSPEDPQFTAVLSGWDFSPGLSSDIFSFAPPPGAAKIEFIPVGE